MSNLLNKQYLQSYFVASRLANLPSGGLILRLQKALSPEDFVKAVDYISEFVVQSMLSVLPQEILNKLDELASDDKKEEFNNSLTTILAINDEAYKASDNGLRFSCNVIAGNKNINLNSEEI